MTTRAATSNTQRIGGSLGIAWKILLLVVAVGLGLQMGLRSAVLSAHASQKGTSFCQIKDANELAKRAGLRGSRVGIQMLTNQREAGAGEVVKARLVNFSTESVISKAEFKIQRYLGTKWVTDPSSPDGPWPRRGRKLKPGEVSSCYRYVVPAGQPAGRYRFLTMVSKGPREFPEVAKFSIGHAR
jgi:hypothetical protein